MPRTPYRSETQIQKLGELSRALTLSAAHDDVTGAMSSAYRILSLRARARDLANDAYISQYLDILTDNVLGSGQRALRVDPRYFVTSQNKKEFDIHAARQVARGFGKWLQTASVRSPKNDKNRALRPPSGGSNWEQILRAVVVDGEAFVRFVRGKDYPAGLGLQVIQPECVPLTLNHDSSKGVCIRYGIEVDAYGAPKAYYVAARNSPDTLQIAGGHYVRVPATDMVHIHDSDAHALRGTPWIAKVEGPCRALQEMEIAVLEAAKIGATKAGFFTRKADDMANLISSDEDAEDDLNDDFYTHFPRSVRPGAFEVLPPGYDLQTFSTDQPSDAYPEFSSSIQRRIASGLPAGSYVSITGDRRGESYSSLRHAIIDEQIAFDRKRRWFIASVAEPFFQEWLRAAVLTNAVRLPGPLERYSTVNWVAPRRPFIDPLKEAKAMAEMNEGGVSNLIDILEIKGKTMLEYFEQKEMGL